MFAKFYRKSGQSGPHDGQTSPRAEGTARGVPMPGHPTARAGAEPGFAWEGWTHPHTCRVQKPVKTCFLLLMRERMLGVRGQDQLGLKSW